MRSSAAVLILISCFFSKFAQSQSNELLIQGLTGKLYLEHTVVAKENWYSVGRLYNVNAKDLAPFNHLTLTQPLIIGQTLQIPLTPANFSQNGLKAAGETLVPVIHITQEKEWMYRISVNYNKVLPANIEKWNNVTPDQIRSGMHLIVGYLKVKTALSALAAYAPALPIAAAPKPAPATPTPATTPTVATSTPATTMPKPTATKPTANASSDSPIATAPVASTPKTSPPAPTTSTPVSSTPATPNPVASTPPTSKPSTLVATTPVTQPVAASPAPHFNGGTFRPDYNDGGKSASGPAGVFKSTSGWQDGKYYALMNNATVGTIVKITDPTTNKTVYAKILGQMPDMKESGGLALRISNAAAAELGEGETARFNVQVSY